MPAPSSSLATLRPDLGTMMEFDLAASRQGFIGLQVFPAFDVPLQGGTYGKIKKANLLTDRPTARGNGGSYTRGTWEFEDASYATKENGTEEPVDDRTSTLYRNFFDAEAIAAMRARDIVLRRMERRQADLAFNTGTFTPTAVVNEWDDHPNATPLDDVEAAVLRLYAKGVVPNALIITWTVFRNLRHCTQIIDRIKASGAGNPATPREVTRQMLAEVFDIPRILVGDAQRNAADVGQTASLTPIWSNEYALVTHVAETQDIQEPCIGRTLHWSADGSQIGAVVETYRDETVRSDIVRARMDTDEKMVYDECGELLSNITT